MDVCWTFLLGDDGEYEIVDQVLVSHTWKEVLSLRSISASASSVKDSDHQHQLHLTNLEQQHIQDRFIARNKVKEDVDLNDIVMEIVQDRHVVFQEREKERLEHLQRLWEKVGTTQMQLTIPTDKKSDDTKNVQLFTPLSLLCRLGDLAALPIVLPTAPVQELVQGVHKACIWGHTAIVDYFIDNCEEELSQDEWNMAFCLAAEHNAVDILILLYETTIISSRMLQHIPTVHRNEDPERFHIGFSHAERALMWAIQKESLESITWLMNCADLLSSAARQRGCWIALQRESLSVALAMVQVDRTLRKTLRKSSQPTRTGRCPFWKTNITSAIKSVVLLEGFLNKGEHQ